MKPKVRHTVLLHQLDQPPADRFIQLHYKERLFAAGDITELRSMACQNTKVRIKAGRMPKDMIYQEIGDHAYDMDAASD